MRFERYVEWRLIPPDKRPRYIVVRVDEDYLRDFCEKVGQLIDQGYTPLGGVSVRRGGERGAELLQAMVYRGE